MEDKNFKPVYEGEEVFDGFKELSNGKGDDE